MYSQESLGKASVAYATLVERHCPVVQQECHQSDACPAATSVATVLGADRGVPVPGVRSPGPGLLFSQPSLQCHPPPLMLLGNWEPVVLSAVQASAHPLPLRSSSRRASQQTPSLPHHSAAYPLRSESGR